MDNIDEIYYLAGECIMLRKKLQANKEKLKSFVGKPIYESTIDVIEKQGADILELIQRIKKEAENI